MYSFEHHGDALTLRPEGTAGAARAYVEHSVHAKRAGDPLVLPRPDVPRRAPAEGPLPAVLPGGLRGVRRPGPAVDAEMIDMLVRFLDELGIKETTVHVNSLGGPGTRARYRDALGRAPRRRKRRSSATTRSAGSRRTRSASSTRRTRATSRPSQSAPVDPRRARRRRPRALRRPAARYLDALGTPLPCRAQARARARLLHAHALRGSRTGGRARRAEALGGGGRYDGMVQRPGRPRRARDRLRARARAAACSPCPRPTCKRRSCVFLAPLGRGRRRRSARCSRASSARLGVAVDLDGRGGSLKSMLRRANASGRAHCVILGEARARARRRPGEGSRAAHAGRPAARPRRRASSPIAWRASRADRRGMTRCAAHVIRGRPSRAFAVERSLVRRGATLHDRGACALHSAVRAERRRMP